MEQKFTEAIKVVDGKFCNIDWHEQRLHRTSKHFFGKPTYIDFDTLTIPDELKQGVLKCRIVYNTKILDVAFSLYSKRTIETVRAVECNTIDYEHKYEDRSMLNFLFEQRENCDDILIIKNGLISDTSYGNVVFKDLNGSLYTPTKPLLAGTKRARLLYEKKVSERDITPKDICLYEGFYIINAMIDLDDNVFVKGHNIFGY